MRPVVVFDTNILNCVPYRANCSTRPVIRCLERAAVDVSYQ